MRARLEDPAAWTPSAGRATALKANGERVPAGDPQASSFDALAALQAAARSRHPLECVRSSAYDAVIAALRAAEAEAGAPLREAGALDHAAVLDLLDRAAARLERA